MGFYETAVSWCRAYPSFPLFVGFGASYFAYYIICVAKRPLLAGKDNKLKTFLLNHCSILKEKYKPTLWCFESRIQTILRPFIKTCPTIPYVSEIISTPDGGQIMLDWHENSNEIYPDTNTRPTVLILPGLVGNSKESYVVHLVENAAKLGYRSVVFNNRGNGGAKLLTPRTYCAANTDDLCMVVSYIKQRYPDAPVIGTGISLGGMILFNYLAKYGSDSQLIAGMTVSVAWNVFESTVTLEQGINSYINRHLAMHLVKSVKKNIKMFEQHYDIDHVMKSRTIREFDDRFTAKVFGYASCDDYYKEASLHDKLHSLKVPILCLNAADDPFSPLHAIPLKDANENDNILIAVTSHGGHIGFLEGLFPRYESYMDRMFAQFIHAVFTYGEKELRAD